MKRSTWITYPTRNTTNTVTCIRTSSHTSQSRGKLLCETETGTESPQDKIPSYGQNPTRQNSTKWKVDIIPRYESKLSYWSDSLVTLSPGEEYDGNAFGSVCLYLRVTQKLSLRLSWFFYTRSIIPVVRSSSKIIRIWMRIWTKCASKERHDVKRALQWQIRCKCSDMWVIDS